MADSKISDNYEGTSLAVTDDSNATISRLLVDPVTGRLLVEIDYETSNDLDVSSKIDENFEGVGLVVTDDASAAIKPIKVNPTSGGLLVDIG